MAKKKTSGIALPDDVISRRLGLYASGAAGVHADQQTKTYATGRTRRVGSRSARLRAAIRTETS